MKRQIQKRLDKRHELLNLCKTTDSSISSEAWNVVLSSILPHVTQLHTCITSRRAHFNINILQSHFITYLTNADMLLINFNVKMWRRGFKSTFLCGRNCNGWKQNCHRVAKTDTRSAVLCTLTYWFDELRLKQVPRHQAVIHQLHKWLQCKSQQLARPAQK